MPAEKLIQTISAQLGTDRVMDKFTALRTYPTEPHFVGPQFLGALRPKDVEEVQACIRAAQEHQTPLYAISTGNNWGYGAASPPQSDCILLDLRALNRIRDFDPLLGVVTVEPGVTQEQLFRFLRDNNHDFLVPVTGAGPACSIVGNAIERGYGITPCADHFLAVTNVEAILADGTMYRSALSRLGADRVAKIFKWQIGPYLDGIFTQSNFGVVTAMTIALARKAESMECFLFSLKDDALLEKAVTAIQDILASLPGLVGGINLMNRHRVLAMASPYPRDKIGPDGLIPETEIAAIGKALQIFPWTGYGTLYGTRRTARAARAEIRKRLRGIASRLVFISDREARILSWIMKHSPLAIRRKFGPAIATLSKSMELLAGQPNETALPLAYWRNTSPPPQGPLNPARDGCGLTWFAPLMPIDPSVVRDFVNFTTTTLRQHQLEPLITLTSVNDRCFDSTVPLLYDPDSPDEVERVRLAQQTLLDTALAHGLAPYRVGANAMDWLRESDPDRWKLASRLKALLDPNEVLAPGRYTQARRAKHCDYQQETL